MFLQTKSENNFFKRRMVKHQIKKERLNHIKSLRMNEKERGCLEVRGVNPKMCKDARNVT